LGVQHAPDVDELALLDVDDEVGIASSAWARTPMVNEETALSIGLVDPRISA
jgi:hypothetical protein